jgi:hypothetical protein
VKRAERAEGANGAGRSAGWMERLGAALAAPARAMAASESSDDSGRQPADLAVLILAGFMASNLDRMVRAGWLLADGSGIDGVHMLLAELSAALMAPLVFVVAGGIAVTLVAGRRRSLAADFDLACVAGVPLAAVPQLLQLIGHVGLWSPPLFAVAVWLSYGWGAALLVLAARQARRRAPREVTT